MRLRQAQDELGCVPSPRATMINQDMCRGYSKVADFQRVADCHMSAGVCCMTAMISLCCLQGVVWSCTALEYPGMSWQQGAACIICCHKWFVPDDLLIQVLRSD